MAFTFLTIVDEFTLNRRDDRWPSMITFNALRLEIDDPQQKVWLSFLGPNGLTVDATFLWFSNTVMISRVKVWFYLDFWSQYTHLLIKFSALVDTPVVLEPCLEVLESWLAVTSLVWNELQTIIKTKLLRRQSHHKCLPFRKMTRFFSKNLFIWKFGWFWWLCCKIQDVSKSVKKF